MTSGADVLKDPVTMSWAAIVAAALFIFLELTGLDQKLVRGETFTGMEKRIMREQAELDKKISQNKDQREKEIDQLEARVAMIERSADRWTVQLETLSSTIGTLSNTTKDINATVVGMGQQFAVMSYQINDIANTLEGRQKPK